MYDKKTMACMTAKNRIESIIKAGKYRDLEEFIKAHPDVKAFQDKTKSSTFIKSQWGYQLSEEDYQQLLVELQQELAERMRIAQERFSTVNVNGKEITTYTSERGTTIVDNSYSNKSVADQLPDLQEKYKTFRDGNGQDKTDEMMDYMEARVKITPKFDNVINFPSTSLTGEEQEKAEVAEAYSANADGPVQVDIETGLMIDKGQILSIEKSDGGYEIVNTEETELVKETPQKTKKKTKKKKLRQAGFSSAVALALLTGLFMGLTFLNLYLKMK
jgi:hypothetical protein